MQKMANQTMNSSNFNFGAQEQEDIAKKSIRYKNPRDSLPVNPKEAYQWLGDPNDMSRLSKGHKKTPIFNI